MSEDPEWECGMRLIQKRAETERKFSHGWMTMRDGTRRPLGEEEAAELLKKLEESEARTAAMMPDEKTTLGMMSTAYHRMKDFGWREIMYCPKDGTMFDAVEAGSSGIHDCNYQGEWPDGSWWIYADGDIWPSRPVLFRLKPTPPSRQPEAKT